MMLHHLGEHEAAQKIQNGLLATFERGIRTGDLGGTANTEDFTRAVCEAVARS